MPRVVLAAEGMYRIFLDEKSACGREDGRRCLHCTVDVIMGYPVLSLVRRDGDERTAADYAADLYRAAAMLASKERDGGRGTICMNNRWWTSTHIEYHSFEVWRGHGASSTSVTVLVIACASAAVI